MIDIEKAYSVFKLSKEIKEENINYEIEDSI